MLRPIKTYLPSSTVVAERSCFLQVTLCPQPTPNPPRQTFPPWADPPGRHPPPARADIPEAGTPSRDGHCSGRYASHWNAFLLYLYFLDTFCCRIFTSQEKYFETICSKQKKCMISDGIKLLFAVRAGVPSLTHAILSRFQD